MSASRTCWCRRRRWADRKLMYVNVLTALIRSFVLVWMLLLPERQHPQWPCLQLTINLDNPLIAGMDRQTSCLLDTQHCLYHVCFLLLHCRPPTFRATASAQQTHRCTRMLTAGMAALCRRLSHLLCQPASHWPTALGLVLSITHQTPWLMRPPAPCTQQLAVPAWPGHSLSCTCCRHIPACSSHCRQPAPASPLHTLPAPCPRSTCSSWCLCSRRHHHYRRRGSSSSSWC